MITHTFLQLLSDFEHTAGIPKPAEQQFVAEWERWCPKICAYAERELSQPLKKKLQRLQAEDDLDDGAYVFLNHACGCMYSCVVMFHHG